MIPTAWYRPSMALRALGLLLTLVGLLLAAINLLYLPAVVQHHGWEWPVVAFHGLVILVGVGLAALGRRLWRR
jgi:hypothetical protein